MITEERLKLYIDDSYIYTFYLGDFDINRKYNSPLRIDPGPSFQIRKSKKSNLIYWKDYGLSNQLGIDAISLVMHLFNLSRKEAVEKIWVDIIESDKPLPSINLSVDITSIPYKFYYGELLDWELNYWNSIGIPKDLLDYYNVKSLTALYRTDKLIWKSVLNSPAYIYLYKNKIDAFKSYRPLDKKGDKFRGQNNGDILEGFEQLPDEWEHLIISKSTKDVMTLRRLGVVSCSPTSENSFRTLLKNKDEINRRFKRKFIFFDNDEPGIKASKLLQDETGWDSISLPINFSKDPSDLVKKDKSYKRLSSFLSNLKLEKNFI